MIFEMIVWGFFSALGWMGAQWKVDKIKPPASIQQEKKDETRRTETSQNVF